MIPLMRGHGWQRIRACVELRRPGLSLGSLLLGAGVLLAACGGGTSGPDEGTGRIVRDRLLGVSLVAPADWDVTYDDDRVTVEAAQASGGAITVFTSTPPESVETFRLMLAEIAAAEADDPVISQGTLDGREVLIGEYTTRDPSSGAEFQVRQYLTTTAPAILVFARWPSDAAAGTATQVRDILDSIRLPADPVRDYQAWARVSTPTDRALFSIVFLDAEVGVAVGQAGTILRTSDGGASWTSASAGTDRTLQGIDFERSGQVGIAVGQEGTILRTTDTGLRWRSIEAPTTSFLTDVAFLSDRATVVAVGTFGTILRSEDLGETWQTVTIDSDESFNAVDAVPGTTDVLVVGRNVHAESGDGGRSWRSLSFSSALRAVDAVAGGFAIGVADGGTIARTDTAGFAWSFVGFIDVPILHGVAVAPDRQFFVVGGQGAIVSSPDAVALVEEASGVEVELRGAAFAPDGTRFAVGDGGVILRSRVAS